MKPPRNNIDPLMIAASRGDLAVVEEILSRHNEDVNAQDDFGYTALMYAASAGHARIVETLLAAGSDLRLKNRQGLASIDLAVARGQAPVALLLRHALLFFAARDGDLHELGNLLELGADVNAQVTDGWTALMVAALHDHPHVVSRLLLHGADPELETVTGRTALMIAQHKGHHEVVGLLHDYGASPLPVPRLGGGLPAPRPDRDGAAVLDLDISAEPDN